MMWLNGKSTLEATTQLKDIYCWTEGKLMSEQWEWIWKTKVPPKIKLFLLKITHKVVPTKSFLAHRGMNLDLKCLWCDLEVEDLDHLFWRCNLESTLWSIISSWLGIRYIIMPNNRFDINYLMKLWKSQDSGSRYWRTFVSVTLWIN